MIDIQRYQKDYFDYIIAMHESQGSQLATALDSGDLPEWGLIAFQGAIPVAAGFLRRMEGQYAQIDTLVSNKDVTSDIRHMAIKTIVQLLIDQAKSLKLKGIISYTGDESVLIRAVETGFKVSPYAVITLTL